MLERHDLDRLDVRDVEVAAEDQIHPDLTGSLQRFSGFPGDVVRPERLYPGKVMVHDEHLESTSVKTREVFLDALPLIPGDQPAHDRPPVRRIDPEHRHPIHRKRRIELGRDVMVEAFEGPQNPGVRPPPGVYVVIAGYRQCRAFECVYQLPGRLELPSPCTLRQIATQYDQIDTLTVHVVYEVADDARKQNLAKVNVRNVRDAHLEVQIRGI